MPTSRRGRSATVKTTSVSEQTVSAESAGDVAVKVTGEQEVDGNGGIENEMIIDLEVKDDKPPDSTETAVKEESPTMVVKDESDVTVVTATTEPADTVAQESVDTDTAVPSTQTATTTDEPIKEEEQSKPAAKPTTTAVVTKPAAKPTTTVVVTTPAAKPTTTVVVTKPAAKPTTTAVVTKPAAKPTTTAVVTKPAAKPSKAAVVTKPGAKPSKAAKTKPLRDNANRPPRFPESLTKLRNLTVNIGPIRLLDLKSEKLHEVLKMNDKFEIKFEMLDKKDADGKTVKEKSGFVRLPFEITTPKFLIQVAFMLGHLAIDGRDMSVKFPEAFNTAVTDCKKYVEDARLLRIKNMEAIKRQISVKNVPVDVTEETVRSLFPEAQTITLKMASSSEGSNVRSVRLEFETEKACIKCLDTHKDVSIEDNKLKLFRLYMEKKPRISKNTGSGRGRGNANPIRGRGGLAGTVRGRGAARGKGVASARNKSVSVASSRNTSRMSSFAMSRPSTSSRGSRASSSYQGQFKDFNPANRQRTGRGSLGYGQQRRDQAQSSNYRTDRSPQQRSAGSYRADTRNHQSSSNKGEDPSAIMQYLQTTLARMEQKISSQDLQAAQSRNVGQFGVMNNASSSSPGMGRGNANSSNRGHGNQNRKRAAADNRPYGQPAKKQFMSGGMRHSVGNVIGTVVSDYRSDYQSSNAGNRSGGYGGGSNDRSRQDSYGNNYGNNYGNSGMSGNVNTGYSGSQYTSSGGGSGGNGWGQTSNMRGYNQSSMGDQMW